MFERDPERLVARRRVRGVGSALLAGSVLAAGTVAVATSVPANAAVQTSALILADTDRDGVLTAADAQGRANWTKDRGALFLANLDDDTSRCPKVGPGGVQLTDVQLASCHDAADRVVNGDDDVADLARVLVQPVDTDDVT